MSSKINILGIIKGHIWTLRDRRTDTASKTDLLLFYMLPLFVAIFAGCQSFLLSKDVVSNIVTTGVLLSGLLLNLIVLVYSLKEKLPKVDVKDPKHIQVQLKHSVLIELYYNIAYSTLVSFFMLIASIAHNLLDKVKFSNSPDVSSEFINSLITDPIIIFLSINLIFSFLMIIKRTYQLLIADE